MVDNQYKAVGLLSLLSKSSFILFILGVFAPQKLRQEACKGKHLRLQAARIPWWRLKLAPLKDARKGTIQRTHPQGAALGLPREARRQPAGDRLAQVAGLRGCRRSASAAAHLYCHHLDATVGYLDFLRQVVHLRQHPGGAAALGHEGTAGISSDPSYGGQNRAVLRLPSPERLRSCCPS